MKRPEEVRLEFTREWVQKAESDFKAAGLLLKAGDDYLFRVAFHAQQAAEKYLKAFLVWHQIEFPKTHDLRVLMKKGMRHLLVRFGDNPTNAVGGTFILGLQSVVAATLNPTNAVGGSFIPSLTTAATRFTSLPSDRSVMNDPPTALVGFGERRFPSV